LNQLPRDIQKEIQTVMEQTANFTGLTVNLLINYGGQDEIIRAVNAHISQTPGEPIDPGLLENFLDNPGLPPVDLLIRTGGEKRISNFLIWQTAYAELYFSDKLWPDWSKKDLEIAIDSFSSRDRRFGGVKK
jgi:undecaprenyl diphosphate synthase